MTPFGASWEDLDLDHLRDFLGEPRNEGLTWEAKGGQIRPEHVREAVCAFGNSILGGYLVLGASQDRATGAWTVGGWQPPTEPETWVGDCLGNGGVSPVPSHLVKAWSHGGSLWVAVVNVRPVAVPPCLTSSGEVWERLSGKSVRVNRTDFGGDSIAWRKMESWQSTAAAVRSSGGIRPSSGSGPSGWSSRRSPSGVIGSAR
jgi:hypothetical protein